MGKLDSILQKLTQVQNVLISIGNQMAKNPLSTGGHISKFNNHLKNTVATSRELAQATKAYNNAVKEANKLEDMLAAGQLKRTDANRKLYNQAIQNEKLYKRLLTETQTAIAKRSGSIAELTARIALNNTKIREQINFTRRLSKADRELINETRRLERQLRKYEVAAKRVTRVQNLLGASFRRSVGGFTLFASQYVGLTAAIYGVVRLMGDHIKVTREFGKESAVLAGILGIQREELEELDMAIASISEKYPVATTEVRRLQIALARLGFTLEEISVMTAPIIEGSVAMNASFSELSNVVGVVVRAFNDLEAADTQRIIDGMTKSTTLSSLSFSKLRVILPKVSGVANAMNIEFEEMLSHLSIINNQIQDASITGTSYRRILANLAKTGTSLSDALDEISSSEDKAATALEMFGARAFVAALALEDARDATLEVEESIRAAGGVAEEMARKQMRTLDGAIKQVNASWTVLVTNMRESENVFAGAARWIRNLIQMIDLATGSERFFDFFDIDPSKWDIESLGFAYYRLGLEARDAYTTINTFAGLADDQLQTYIDTYSLYIKRLGDVSSAEDEGLARIYQVVIQHAEAQKVLNRRRKETENWLDTLSDGDNILVQFQKRLKELEEERELPWLTPEDIAMIAEEIEMLQSAISDLLTVDPDVTLPEVIDWMTKRMGDLEKAAEEARREAIKFQIVWNEIMDEFTSEEAVPSGFAEELFDATYGGAADFAKRSLLDQEAFINQSYYRQLEMLRWLLDNEKIEYEEYFAAIGKLQEMHNEKQEDQNEIQKASVQDWIGGIDTLTTGFGELGQTLTDDAKRQKELAIATATIQAFLAAAYGVVQGKGNLVLAAIYAAGNLALGLARVNEIRKTPIPEYAEGTEHLQRGDNPQGKDTIPIMANEGERIVPTKINKMLMGVSNNALPGIVHMGVEYKEGMLMLMKTQIKQTGQTNRLLRGGLKWTDHDGSIVDADGNRKKYIN